jgi:hypothetical protein
LTNAARNVRVDPDDLSGLASTLVAAIDQAKARTREFGSDPEYDLGKNGTITFHVSEDAKRLLSNSISRKKA